MMQFLFSDRFWILKAAVALGALSGLCTLAQRDISTRYPPLERLPLWPEAPRDRIFHLTARRVDAADPQGFQVGTEVGPMRFLTGAPPPVGAFVSVNARPIGPRTLQVLDLAVHSGYHWKRPLNYGVSILTVLGYLWLVRRRFRWRMEEGVFRSRY